jgi:Holliday junction resolvasome RuvABC endonuclease subunit
MTDFTPITILAIDPAVGFSGWSHLEMTSSHPFHVNILRYGEINGKVLLKQRKEMAKIFKDQYCLLDVLEEEYTKLVKELNPSVIVVEGAFAHLHIAAFASIKLLIHTIRRVSEKVLNKDVVEIPPTVSKKAFTGSGAADKDHMRLAYQTNKYLSGVVADDQIGEHSIDSVAHGIGYFKVYVLGSIQIQSSAEKRRLKQEKKKAKALALLNK